MRKRNMQEREGTRQASEPQFAAFLAIDWADEKHVWCLQVTGQGRRESGELEHKVETVEAWVAQSVPTIRQSSDRDRRGTKQGSFGVHACQV